MGIPMQESQRFAKMSKCFAETLRKHITLSSPESLRDRILSSLVYSGAEFLTDSSESALYLSVNFADMIPFYVKILEDELGEMRKQCSSIRDRLCAEIEREASTIFDKGEKERFRLLFSGFIHIIGNGLDDVEENNWNFFENVKSVVGPVSVRSKDGNTSILDFGKALVDILSARKEICANIFSDLAVEFETNTNEEFSQWYEEQGISGPKI